MSLPVNIEDLMHRHRVEDSRVEFKRGWNPASIYRTLCAFANDIDNLGGGYVIVGVEEGEHGMARRPVVGVPVEQLDSIQQQMIGFNKFFSPHYMPRVSVEEVDGQSVIVIWAPVGINRPYSIRTDVTTPQGKREAFYIRTGSSTIEARGEVLDELRDLAARVPFDGRGNPDITEEDIDLFLIRAYLQKVKSRMVDELKYLSTMDLLERMDLLTGPSERRMITNVAAMMFCDHPEKFFPYTQVSVVVFPEGKVVNPNRFSEKTFRGSVPSIIQGVMQYLKDVIITEYVFKPRDSMKSLRWFNYPYQALEEAVVNAMYHRDYQSHQEVEVTIEPDGVRILSISGPDRSISNEAIREAKSLHARRYRNNRLGDFLKELDLTEGRSTGIPTIQSELARNGSPRASIETDEDRSYFLMFIPVHEACGDTAPMDESAQRWHKTLPKEEVFAQTRDENLPEGVERVPKKVQTLPKDDEYLAQRLGESLPKGLSPTAQIILQAIIESPKITVAQLSSQLSRPERTIKYHIAILKRKGILVRIGGRSSGQWHVNLA